MISGYLIAMVDLNKRTCYLLEKKVSNKNLIETAKPMFRLWKYAAKIVDAPKVIGIYDEEFGFDFAVDDTYVDDFKPMPRSSADLIRKSVACFDVEGKRLRTLGMLDD